MFLEYLKFVPFNKACACFDQLSIKAIIDGIETSSLAFFLFNVLFDSIFKTYKR